MTVLMGLLGTILARILINDSRFVARQDAMLSARQAARAAMNAVSVELRMVAQGGLLAASRDSVVARVPYAFGMACQTLAGTVIVSIVPADSLTYARATPDGLAWRDPWTGVYRFATLSGVVASSRASICAADSIRVLPGGWTVDIAGVPGAQRPPAGALVYLYQTLAYRFGASAELAGRRALWRRQGTAGTYEEIVVPFDTAAGFAFLVGPSLAVQEAPPADLATVRGLELRLITESETTVSGTGDPERFRLVTRVPFLNVVGS